VAAQDFDAARRERIRRRTPIEFTLGGETFSVLPVIPVGIGFDLVDAPDFAVDGVGASRAFANFIEQCLPDADVDRFRKVLRSKAEPVDPDALLELMEWLTAEYTARPTGPSNGSSAGRNTDGRNSNRKRSAKASGSSPT
jgi:hypothetical protein